MSTRPANGSTPDMPPVLAQIGEEFYAVISHMATSTSEACSCPANSDGVS